MVILLKSVRIRHELTIRQLSELSEVSRAYISEIERGETIPTIETICKLAKGLGISPEELYECE